MEPKREPSSRALTALLLGLPLLIWVFSKLSTPSDNFGEFIRSQDTPKAERHGSQPRSARELIVHPPTDSHKSDNGGGQKRAWWEKAAVCIAFGLLVLNFFQMRATQNAADAAKRSADSGIASNRAWVVPDSPPQHKRVIEEANLEWHNAGKTPAIGVFSWKEYFSGKFPGRMNTCTESESVAEKQPLDSRQYQAFVSEGGRYEIGLDHAPDWVGQQPIFIHGCIWYTDISSNTEKSSEFFYVAFQNKYGFPSSEGISIFFDRPFIYK